MAIRLTDYRPFLWTDLETPVTDIPDSPTDVLTLQADIEAGEWMVMLSALLTETGTTDGALIRYTGTLPSPDFIREFSNNRDDNWVFSYSFPFRVAADQTVTMTMQVEKVGTAGVLNVTNSNIAWKRMG